MWTINFDEMGQVVALLDSKGCVVLGKTCCSRNDIMLFKAIADGLNEINYIC